MFVWFRRPLTQNVIQRSIRYCQTYNGKITISKIHKQKENDLFEKLVSTLGSRTSLSVDEWKEFRSKAKMQRLASGTNEILTAIESLDISQNPLKIAESFIEAFNIERNVIVDRIFIDLYAAKATREKLTQSEEEDLIKLCQKFVENGMSLLPEMSATVFNGFLASANGNAFFKCHECILLGQR